MQIHSHLYGHNRQTPLVACLVVLTLRILSLSSEHKLIITNTTFQMKNEYKASWMYPRSKHWHLTRQQDLHEISITRAMRGAECWTDHRLIRSKIHLMIQPQNTRHQLPRRLNFRALKSPDITALYSGSTLSSRQNYCSSH